jgi:hypothetical protein
LSGAVFEVSFEVMSGCSAPLLKSHLGIWSQMIQAIANAAAKQARCGRRQLLYVSFPFGTAAGSGPTAFIGMFLIRSLSFYFACGFMRWAMPVREDRHPRY